MPVNVRRVKSEQKTALVPFPLAIFSSKHHPDSSSYATGVGSYLASRYCGCGRRRALKPEFRLPSPIPIVHPRPHACRSDSGSIPTIPTSAMTPASASASGLSSLSFKFAFIGRSSRRILIHRTQTRRQHQRWSVDDEEGRFRYQFCGEDTRMC